MDINNLINSKESFLVSEDGKFLGKLSSNQYDLNSIFNKYGLYGSKYGLNSINNQYSLYGSIYGLYSPNNQYSISPPTIYLKGVKYGYLSRNKYKLGNIIDPDLLDNWIKINGL